MLNKTTLLSLNMECFLKPLSMRTVSVKTDDWHLWQITNLNVTIKLHSLWLLKTKIWRWDSIQKQGKVLMSVSPHKNWQQRKPALIVSHESEPTDTRHCQEISATVDCNPVHFCIDWLMFYNQRQKSMSTSTNNWG